MPTAQNFSNHPSRPGGNGTSSRGCRSWTLSCWVRSFCGKRPQKERFMRKLLWICLDACCTLDVFHLPDFSSLHIGWCALSQICWPAWPNQRPVPMAVSPSSSTHHHFHDHHHHSYHHHNNNDYEHMTDRMHGHQYLYNKVLQIMKNMHDDGSTNKYQ